MEENVKSFYTFALHITHHTVMASFIGEYKAKVDDRGRLVFPAAFKELCADTLSQGFVVKKSLFADCLEMFAYSEWERDSQEVKPPESVQQRA